MFSLFGCSSATITNVSVSFWSGYDLFDATFAKIFQVFIGLEAADLVVPDQNFFRCVAYSTCITSEQSY